jgi:hypothetical protein
MALRLSRQPPAEPHRRSRSTGTLPPHAPSGPCVSSSGPGDPSAGSAPDQNKSNISVKFRMKNLMPEANQ